VAEAVATVPGPVIVIANLLTEGRGMAGFSAADAVRRVSDTIGRPVDAVVVNTGRPPDDIVERYAAEHKHPLEVGELPSTCELVSGEFWFRDLARHDRRRLALAVWAVLSQRLL